MDDDCGYAAVLLCRTVCLSRKVQGFYHSTAPNRSRRIHARKWGLVGPSPPRENPLIIKRPTSPRLRGAKRRGIRVLGWNSRSGWNSRIPPDSGWKSGKAAGNHEATWNSRKSRGIQPIGVEFRLCSGIRRFFKTPFRRPRRFPTRHRARVRRVAARGAPPPPQAREGARENARGARRDGRHPERRPRAS